MIIVKIFYLVQNKNTKSKIILTINTYIIKIGNLNINFIIQIYSLNGFNLMIEFII